MMVHGIIANISTIPSHISDIEIKEIQSIAITSPVLNRHQIQTMLQYAQKHAIHIHKVVSFFIPAPIKNRILKYGLEIGVSTS
jgi:primosomal protein N'